MDQMNQEESGRIAMSVDVARLQAEMTAVHKAQARHEEHLARVENTFSTRVADLQSAVVSLDKTIALLSARVGSFNWTSVAGSAILGLVAVGIAVAKFMGLPVP